MIYFCLKIYKILGYDVKTYNAHLFYRRSFINNQLINELLSNI